tara:strand:- start:247 stop:1056 length:810 start_codon:yes stop_codon:yes gene_type:complete
MQKDILSHIIPKSFTKKWEIRKGKLRYYCFKDEQIKEEDSLKLFAKEGLFTQEEEKFLNKYFEAPISGYMDTITTKGDVLIKKTKVYRAFVLMIFQMIARLNISLNGRSDQNIFSMSELDLNNMISAINKNYQIIRLVINPTTPLFYPSSGLILFFNFDSPELITRSFIPICLPITPNQLICMVDKKYDLKLFEDRCKDNTFQRLSISTTKGANKVLIPPSLKDSDENEIINFIKKARINNDLELKLHKEINTLVRDMCDAISAKIPEI